MKKNTLFLLATLFAVAFTACKKDNGTPAEPAVTQTDNAKKVLSYIVDLGFPAHRIVENSTEFIVEDDIIFPKNMKVPEYGKPRTEQFYTGSLVSSTNVTNIRLKVDPSMSGLTSEINSAIAQWNSISGCRIHWSIVTGSSYDVLITDYNLGSGVCGQGTFPSGGLAGNLIRINASYIAGNSFAQRARTICHEMGHNVSFRHTNWAAIGESSATPVPGVPGTDATSIMNGGQCGSGATVLSTKDKQAAVALYPL
ncbi:M57 family metalloprotease [Chitinophaga vietnamensis]|uniref:M57 family metalloprotease n=1 Tax=Chitinophaga vietnamensis TaxID=2593957 RepID=UPI0011779561|nr:M57 family metalloprotease [Chitinophaga vietnamensis]